MAWRPSGGRQPRGLDHPQARILTAIATARSITATTAASTFMAARVTIEAVQKIMESTARTKPLQCACPGPDGDALFDQKGADLVDRRCPPGHQPRPHMTRLQVELVLALLPDHTQVR